MLTKCPECELPVSTSAETCPHCGFPLVKRATAHKKTQKSHLRLPNGFGQITKLSNPHLRKPYRAMVTVGKTDTGKPICKILKPNGYFESYNDAYAALVEYNRNPYDLDDVITVSELYDRWTAEYFKSITPSSTRTIISAWSYCGSVENINVRALKPKHIKACIDNCDKGSVKSRIKSMFNLMLDYAVEHDLVEYNVARKFKTDSAEVENGHHSFTDEEMKLLWDNQAIPFVNFILLQCYTGWRPQELCKIRMADVNINDWTMTGGMKTKAGKNRTVPLCDKIVPIGKKIYELSKLLGSEYFICQPDGSPMTYDVYYKRFRRVMSDIGIDNHSPHDPRKQFITMCKNSSVDEYAIKRMAGHAIDDITEAVYTDRDSSWLKNEVNKIN